MTVLYLAAVHAWRVSSADTPLPDCTFSTELEALGEGESIVSVDVSHTYDGVPPADWQCQGGEFMFSSRCAGITASLGRCLLAAHGVAS